MNNFVEWNFFGRPPIKDGKKFFCWHRESEGQPRKVHTVFPDIERVQCERCGWWHLPTDAPSEIGKLFRHMARGKY